MSAIKPIIRELKEAALKGGVHAKDKLHVVTENLDGHLDDIIRQVRDRDNFDDKPRNPPIDRDRNPDWLNDRLDRTDLPYWRRRMAEGDQFNYQNHHRYPENEVRTQDGKYLDSYDPGQEIVSRKNTQLDGVRPETARQYVDEVLTKYGPGTKLADGRTLRGDPILELPVQNGTVPPEIIAYANGRTPPVIIRDVLGNEYN